MPRISPLIIVGALSFWPFIPCFSQKVGADSTAITLKKEQIGFKNNLYFEVGGALWYSLGYERKLIRFDHSRIELYSNVDISYLPQVDVINTDFGFGITYGNRHKLDFELDGMIQWNLLVPIESYSDQWALKKQGRDYILPIETGTSIGVGYRTTFFNRLIVRAKPIYIFQFDFVSNRLAFSKFWFSVAIGYQFGKK